ncbi:kinase-like domain-containing protein [Xylaria nigripes]|nr:kinase-like domain-containing protein [Xylaria nigripes]
MEEEIERLSKIDMGSSRDETSIDHGSAARSAGPDMPDYDWYDLIYTRYTEDFVNSISSRERFDRAIVELVESEQSLLRKAFSRSRFWEMEKMLGFGSDGVTVLLRNRHPLRICRKQRVVLKRPIRPPYQGEDEGPIIDALIYEIEAYKNLRGSSHCARMLRYCEDLSNYERLNPNKAAEAWRRFKEFFMSPVKTVFPVLSQFTGPAILLEFIENGSLLKLYQTLKDDQFQLPNRVLWSFYFCLVRACIGMAYPQKSRFGLGSRPVLETIPETMPDGYPMLPAIVHRDIAPRNIMLANQDVSLQEHSVAPKLMLIDFGRAVVADPEFFHKTITRNLLDCAGLILLLINPYSYDIRSTRYRWFNGVKTLAVDILPSGVVNSYPDLDPELRDLLVEALAKDPAERPSLDAMFERTRAGMRKPASSYVGREQEESDESITELLQTLIYDA